MAEGRRSIQEEAAHEHRLVDAALALVNARPSAIPIGEVRYGKGPYATWTRTFLERVKKSPRKPKANFAVSDIETIVSQVLVLVAKGSGPLGADQAHAIVNLTGLSAGLTVAYLVGLTEKNRDSGALFGHLRDLAATAGAMEAADMMHDVPSLIAVLNGMGQVVARATQAGQVGRLKALDAILSGIEHNMRAGAEAAVAAGRAGPESNAGKDLVFFDDEPEPPPQRMPAMVAVAPAVAERPLPPRPVAPVTGIDGILQELGALVGMAEVKREFATLVDKARLMVVRRDVGLVPYKVSRHFAFVGNPGTGKATVARLLSGVYGELDLLTRGHLSRVEGADLVDPGTPGGSAVRTRAAMEPARGGILLIENAHAMTEGELAPYGQEAIDALVRVMRDHRCDIVVVLSGAEEPMRAFLAANPGIAAHVPQTVRFADHSTRELVGILASFVRSARCEFDRDALLKVLEVMEGLCAVRPPGFDNARLSRRLFDAIVASRDERLATSPGSGRAVIAADVVAAAGLV